MTIHTKLSPLAHFTIDELADEYLWLMEEADHTEFDCHYLREELSARRLSFEDLEANLAERSIPLPQYH